MSDTQSSMDSKFENSLRTPSMRAQRIFDIQDRVREIDEKVVPELQEEKLRLEAEKSELRNNCEHVMPSGHPAWDDYFGKGKNEKCRICYKDRGSVLKALGGLKPEFRPAFSDDEGIDIEEANAIVEEPKSPFPKSISKSMPKDLSRGWK